VAGLREVTCGSVAFQMAPRLNAAGRLEDALLGVDLLLQPSAERALAIARLLDDFNRERQQIERQTLEQAIERLERGGEGGDHTIVLADERWHPGVIGIVASRLVERYHRPTVLIAIENGQGRGSARSIHGFHLYRALQLCREHLTAFGGHEFAAGASLAADAVPAFTLAFERAAAAALRPEDLLPGMGHDGDVLLEELTHDAVRGLAGLSPFGAGNPEAVFLLRGVHAQQVAVVGERHLRLTLRQGGFSLPAIAFGAATRRDELTGELDALGTPTLNEWRGRVSVQLRLKDFRPARRSDGL
jgi:single-stranded-DNA-specific exonuclease